MFFSVIKNSNWKVLTKKKSSYFRVSLKNPIFRGGMGLRKTNI